MSTRPASEGAGDDDTSPEGDAYFTEHGFRRSRRPFDAAQTRRRLGDIVEQASICTRIVTDGREAFVAETFEALKTRMAAARSIEILAEATAKLHSDYKEHFPAVHWRNLYRMRTLTVHHYDKVRDELIWAAMSTNIPEMVAALGLPGSPSDPVPLPGKFDG